MQKHPVLIVHPDYDNFLAGILTIAQQNDCIVVFSNQINKNHIAVQKDIGCLILTKKNLPNSAREFLSIIECFIDDFKIGLIILQGYPECLNQLKPEIGLGLFAKLFLEEGVGIIPTRDLQDSVFCLKSLATRVQIRDNPPNTARIKSKAKNVFEEQNHLLSGLYNCGLKKTIALQEIFKNPYQIFESIKNCPENIIKIHGFGTDFTNLNKKLLMVHYE